jgi:branched-chain amino acid transport system substrate-binding protein
MPHGGPASAYDTAGKVEAAHFEMVNLRGDTNGCKINRIPLDEGYSPAKTVEQVQRRNACVGLS